MAWTGAHSVLQVFYDQCVMMLLGAEYGLGTARSSVPYSPYGINCRLFQIQWDKVSLRHTANSFTGNYG